MKVPPPQVSALTLEGLQSGVQEAETVLISVLEHGLQVLESVPHVPRKEKKTLRLLCERVETALEEMDTQTAEMVQQCDTADHTELMRVLNVVCALNIGSGGIQDCLHAVTGMLEALEQCRDPIKWASRAIASTEAQDRQRGLSVLRDLERVVLSQPVEAEMSVAVVLCEQVLDDQELRSDQEQCASWMSLFALGLRNCSGMEMADALYRLNAEGHPLIVAQVFSGTLRGQQGVAVWCCCEAVRMLCLDLSQQCKNTSTRALMEKAIYAGLSATPDCTAARFAELLPLRIELSASKDIAMASGAVYAIQISLSKSVSACASVVTASQELPTAVLTVLRRAMGGQLRRSATWWKERTGTTHLDMVCAGSGIAQLLVYLVPCLKTLPHGNTAWEELLAEGIHILKINQEAELSAKEVMPWCSVCWAARLVDVAAREDSRRGFLLASGVVDALMWTTAHDCLWCGLSIASYTAGPMVALIGRNEGGLTLTHEAINAVLEPFHYLFDYDSTDQRVTSRLNYPPSKIVVKALPIVDIVISDANKPFVVQHSHAIDDLVAGLLVDNDPLNRRAQNGAEKLQATCAHALHYLALSDIGKGPLRSHSGVMAALRKMAEEEADASLSAEARRYASGALFELDEAVRQKTQREATDASSQERVDSVVEHVMLSYNWNHQAVIKRINTALKARGYIVWIDIEKMQGSTVEAMSTAVEDCAVMCYGVSEAYKESTNCRMEAQYAFQQQKDMVPLKLVEGYNANGWLGMMLGVRLWYGFYGSVLASEGAFEAKLVELCRELGERGLAMERPKPNVEASSSLSRSQVPSAEMQLRGDDDGVRIQVVEGVLEGASRVIATAVRRKERKGLSRRTEALLDDLDVDDVPAWVASPWSAEQAKSLLQASEKLWATEKAKGVSSSDVASAVASVLAALEEVAASHVDKAEALLASMRSEELEEVAAVLEHGLAVLEKLSLSSKRKVRKVIDELCEQVEQAVEGLDDQGAIEQLASCEVSELTILAGHLKMVSNLKEADAGEGCVSAMTVVLKSLARCLNPVAGATRVLVSEDTGARMRGLEALRILPRVLLPQSAQSEVSVATVLGEIGCNAERNDGERVAAWMALFALGFRNGAATLTTLGKWAAEGVDSVVAAVFEGRLHGREGLAVSAAWFAAVSMIAEISLKHTDPAVRSSAEKEILALTGLVTRLDCTAAQYEDLLLVTLKLSPEIDDLVSAAGTFGILMYPLIASGAQCAGVITVLPEFPPAALALLRRINGQQLCRPAAWWKERCEGIHLDSVCSIGWGCVMTFVLGNLPQLPPNNAAWEELLAEGIHLCKINKEAGLSTQATLAWYPFNMAIRIVGVAARDPSRHQSLLASRVVDALLWTTAHDYPFIGSGLAEYSAGATVALIGRNEGGLTLTGDAIHVVLNAFHDFWDATSTHWRVKSAAKAPVKKIVIKAQPIADMVISDANKPFVVQHKSAIDDLVKGLLIDDSSPRRTQDGAGKLQEICALVLQNLALSDVGKRPLRSHPNVMTALRAVATAEGMTEEARRYASGALFELDEAVRQKAKDARQRQKTMAQAYGSAKNSEHSNDEVAEHVMLSYNWNHQAVIKRINTALKARGYIVWIDIEKMQGSTVEAMSTAVEDCAVMCYGVSEAYKESTNCRMEAQYAFQQQKDMVPLMLVEGYNANGWLGMMMGVRLWYGFFGAMLASEGAFEAKVDELCRELGKRGKTY